MDAGKVIDSLFEDNTYQTYKLMEAKIKGIKTEIKSRFGEEEMRREFRKQGVVAKWIKEGTYNVKVQELNEFLYNVGLLIPCNKFEDHVLKKVDPLLLFKIEPFKNPITQYVKFYPNKNGKVEVELEDLTTLSDQQLIEIWLESKSKLKECEQKIKEAREEMAICKNLLKSGKVSCKRGSVSLVDNRNTYNMEKAFKELGLDFLIRYSTTSFGSLEKFYTSGMITQKEINEFKVLTGYNLNFMIIELETETKQRQVFYDKLIKGSLNRERKN